MDINDPTEGAAFANAAFRQLSGIRRLERVADLLFTVALIALVWDIALLAESYTATDDTWSYIGRDLNVYLAFLVNFGIIGFYWVTHRKYFAHYVRTDGRHTAYELLFYVAILSMPFSNFIMGKDETGLVPIVFVSFEIFVAGILLWLSWSYATWDDRLTDPEEVTADQRREMQIEALVAPLSAVVAVLFALIHPLLWLSAFIVVPIAVNKLNLFGSKAVSP